MLKWLVRRQLDAFEQAFDYDVTCMREMLDTSWRGFRLFQPGPEAMHELANDLSYAFMLTLEKLSPLERAAFLLHDVFDMDFREIASVLGRSESACRQLASRARSNVHATRPSFKVTPETEIRLADAFVNAIRDGDIEPDANGLIKAIYVMRNPEKLQHVTP